MKATRNVGGRVEEDGAYTSKGLASHDMRKTLGYIPESVGNILVRLLTTLLTSPRPSLSFLFFPR